MDLHIQLLFPTPVAIWTIDEDLSQLERIKEEFEYTSANNPNHSTLEVTKEKRVLEFFPKEKAIINNLFNIYTKEYLHLTNATFAITTSWGTRAPTGATIIPHPHMNAVYTGVLYLDDSYEGGELTFDDTGLKPRQLYTCAPTTFNDLNSTAWTYYPRKNSLVIFPWYLYHHIKPVKSRQPRHSLAMNWFPTGVIGDGGDSTAYLTVH